MRTISPTGRDARMVRQAITELILRHIILSVWVRKSCVNIFSLVIENMQKERHIVYGNYFFYLK